MSEQLSPTESTQRFSSDITIIKYIAYYISDGKKQLIRHCQRKGYDMTPKIIFDVL